MLFWSFSLYYVMLNRQAKKNCEDFIYVVYSKYPAVAAW